MSTPTSSPTDSGIDVVIVIDENLNGDIKTLLDAGNEEHIEIFPQLLFQTAISGRPVPAGEVMGEDEKSNWHFLGSKGLKCQSQTCKDKDGKRYNSYNINEGIVELNENGMGWMSNKNKICYPSGSTVEGAGSTIIPSKNLGSKPFKNVLDFGNGRKKPFVDMSWSTNYNSGKYYTDEELMAMTIVAGEQTGTPEPDQLEVRFGDIGTKIVPRNPSSIQSDDNPFKFDLSKAAKLKVKTDGSSTEQDAYFYRIPVSVDKIFGIEGLTPEMIATAQAGQSNGSAHKSGEGLYQNWTPSFSVKSLLQLNVKITETGLDTLGRFDADFRTNPEGHVGSCLVSTQTFIQGCSENTCCPGVSCTSSASNDCQGITSTTPDSTWCSPGNVSEETPSGSPAPYAGGAALLNQNLVGLTNPDTQVSCGQRIQGTSALGTYCAISAQHDETLGYTFTWKTSNYVTGNNMCQNLVLNSTDHLDAPSSLIQDDGQTYNQALTGNDGGNTGSPCALYSRITCNVVKKGKFPWWGWLLIAIAIAAVLVGVGFLGKAIHDRKVHPESFK